LEMMSPMLVSAAEPANLRTAASMSRRRYLCTQITSLCVTLFVFLGLGFYAVIQMDDLRQFLKFGCNMFSVASGTNYIKNCSIVGTAVTATTNFTSAGG
jgi:hypothetical protein